MWDSNIPHVKREFMIKRKQPHLENEINKHTQKEEEEEEEKATQLRELKWASEETYRLSLEKGWRANLI